CRGAERSGNHHGQPVRQDPLPAALPRGDQTQWCAAADLLPVHARRVVSGPGTGLVPQEPVSEGPVSGCRAGLGRKKELPRLDSNQSWLPSPVTDVSNSFWLWPALMGYSNG